MTASFTSVRRVRPTGFDRAVMRLSLAMLLWARRRAERTFVSPEEHALMRRAQAELQRRDYSTAVFIASVRRAP